MQITIHFKFNFLLDHTHHKHIHYRCLPTKFSRTVSRFLSFLSFFLFFPAFLFLSLPSTNGGTNNFPNPSQLLELFQLSAESFESRICIQLDPFRTCFNANTSPFTLSYVFNSYKVLFEGI